MRACLAITSFLICSGSFQTEVAGQPGLYSWHNVAIGGGGFVTGIITSKTQADLMYVRTDVGGAYRWNGANEKWVPLLDWVSENELGYMGVESIAVDPVEPGNVYLLAGTSYFNNGKTAILRSDDYGNTFSVVDVTAKFKAHGNGMGRQTGEKLQVDPNSNNILYCGTRAHGLFRSTDSGVTWNKITGLNVTTTPNGNGISFVVADPSTGSAGSPTQLIIAGISRQGSNLYISEDGGTSFKAIAGAPETLMPHRAVLSGDRNLFITYANNAGPWDITEAGKIWKYNLETGTWADITPSGFAGAFGGISVDPLDPERIVASSINTWQMQDDAWGDRIFLSTDGGGSWTDVVARGFDLDPNGSPWIEGNAIHWAGCIEFDPLNTKKVWVVSGNGVFSTDDIDATINVWKFNIDGLEETVPLDLVSVPNGPLVSAIGDYDGFRHTGVDVSNYAPIHAPRMGTTHGIACASLNPRIMLRTGDEKMFYSEDGGSLWTECSRNGNRGSVAVSADGRVFLHSAENSGTVYRSGDKGITWTVAEGIAIDWARPVSDPVNPKKFYAYGNSDGSFLVSADGGISFSSAASPGSGGSKIIQAAPGREGDVWVALYAGGLARSDDSGESFSKLDGITYCGAVGFGKQAPGKTYPAIYIWGRVNNVLGIHRSTDEGLTWQRVNDDEHEFGGPANGQFVRGDMNVYGRVYMSTAGRGIVYGETDDTCLPDFVVPYIGIGEEEVEQVALVSVEEGGAVRLSPESAGNGSWHWSGPGGFTSDEREVTFATIEAGQGGIYSVTFVNAAGCESAAQALAVFVNVKVQGIAVHGEGDLSIIDEKNGTLRMFAVLSPADATAQHVVWSVDDTDIATISDEGLLSAKRDGEVTVRATATDGSGVFGEAVITISGQLVTSEEERHGYQFQVYPVPATSHVVILNAEEITHIALLDARGNELFAMSNDDPVVSIPLNGLAGGLYLLKIQCRDRTSCSRRIVKH